MRRDASRVACDPDRNRTLAFGPRPRYERLDGNSMRGSEIGRARADASGAGPRRSPDGAGDRQEDATARAILEEVLDRPEA